MLPGLRAGTGRERQRRARSTRRQRPRLRMRSPNPRCPCSDPFPASLSCRARVPDAHLAPYTCPATPAYWLPVPPVSPALPIYSAGCFATVLLDTAHARPCIEWLAGQSSGLGDKAEHLPWPVSVLAANCNTAVHDLRPLLFIPNLSCFVARRRQYALSRSCTQRWPQRVRRQPRRPQRPQSARLAAGAAVAAAAAAAAAADMGYVA